MRGPALTLAIFVLALSQAACDSKQKPNGKADASSGSDSGGSSASGTGGSHATGTGGRTGTGSGGSSGRGAGSGGRSAPGSGGRGSASGGGGAATGGGGAGDAGTGGAANGTGGMSGSGTPPASGASVLQHHNHASRDGVYVDAKLTKTAAGALKIDPRFAKAMITGPTYAQPLYLAGGSGKPDLVIVATEQNHVFAFDAADATKLWEQTLATPLPRSALNAIRSGCGNIDPLGVTGTPVIDESTRTLFLDAMTQGSGNSAHHMVYALSADDGKTLSGWPVDLNAKAKAGNLAFESLVHNQRGALVLAGGKVFVPFGGHIGDCGNYHGWIVGISESDPSAVSGWATRAIAGGIWAPGGVVSDGTSVIFATGNTEAMADDFSAPAQWGDGEAIFKLPPSLTFSGQNNDYFVPTNWMSLDNGDTDVGGTNPMLLEVPGATPSSLVIGLGKDGKIYLLDASSLGGITTPLGVATVASRAIINAGAAYTTKTASYVVFKGTGSGCPQGQSGGLVAVKIAKASPPTASVAWCGGPATSGSPAVSMSDAAGSDAIVWIVGSDNKLHGLDADTGTQVFDGGAAAMSAVAKFQTPIVTGGRVFVAANNQVYAYTSE